MRVTKCIYCGSENKKNSKFCAHCGKELPDDGIGHLSDPNSPSASTNKPTVAMFLSIIPGLGQIYNGDVLKGIVMFLSCFVIGITGIGLIVVVAWSVIDAYQVAKGNWKRWTGG